LKKLHDDELLFIVWKGTNDPARVIQHPQTQHHGWMVHGQDTFFSLGSCSPANLAINEGSKNWSSSNWMASKTKNEGGAFMGATSSSTNMVLAIPLFTTTMSAFVPPPIAKATFLNTHEVFFWGKILPNFKLKKYDFYLYKGFSVKKISPN
jgi:hypothetical protein